MAEANVPYEYRRLCAHYSRGCSLLAPCCGKPYPCRLCHDESENHKLVRSQVVSIECRNCKKLQEVTNKCSQCAIVFGTSYYCRICCLFDDLDKGQYHCSGCGICRVGGKDKFFHCSKCCMCWSKEAQATHKCRDNSSHTVCPVCMEDVHSSRDSAQILKCSHFLHTKCYRSLLDNGLYKCPLCNASMVDMNCQWKKMDEEKNHWPMPRRYRNFYVQVLCQDCHENTTTLYHVVGLKCTACGSYNTSRSGNEEAPTDSDYEDEDGESTDDGSLFRALIDQIRERRDREELVARIQQLNMMAHQQRTDDEELTNPLALLLRGNDDEADFNGSGYESEHRSVSNEDDEDERNVTSSEEDASDPDEEDEVIDIDSSRSWNSSYGHHSSDDRSALTIMDEMIELLHGMAEDPISQRASIPLTTDSTSLPADDQSEDDDSSSWETEEEQEVIGEPECASWTAQQTSRVMHYNAIDEDTSNSSNGANSESEELSFNPWAGVFRLLEREQTESGCRIN